MEIPGDIIERDKEYSMISRIKERIMKFDYDKEMATPVTLVLGNGTMADGFLIGLRINPGTLPAGKRWYHVRHADDDGSRPASLKRGCVAVNFLGTLICDPITGMEDGDEVEITEFNYER